MTKGISFFNSLFFTLFLGFISLNVSANPEGGKVVSGNITIQQESPTKLGVTQTTQKGIINWQKFNIDINEHTQFYQPSSSSITLNRVVTNEPSKILGKLTANGRIFIVNQNGILFGKTAQVDVAGLVASVHDINDSDFLSGKLDFSIPGKPGSSIINKGNINIYNQGIAAFVAPSVQNSGVIVAKLGKVELASANGFTLDLYGDELISFVVDDKIAKTAFDLEGNLLESFTDNSGTIQANGGYVALTANVARDVVNSVVNQSGIIEVKSIDEKDGKIILNGGEFGDVRVTGSLDTSGDSGNGGVIEIKAQHLSTDGVIDASGQSGGHVSLTGKESVSIGGKIKVNGEKTGGFVNVKSGKTSVAGQIVAIGDTGQGGKITLETDQRHIDSSTAKIDASGAKGGVIQVEAGNITSSGEYQATGYEQQGGNIDVSADQNITLLSAKLDASGKQQGGLVRVGGAYQGGQSSAENDENYETFVSRFDTNSDIENSQNTLLNDSTHLDVSSSQGDGGTAIIWSDKKTTFLGNIDATGATKGGAVEISSKEILQKTALSNVHIGKHGQLLIDPKNIIVGGPNNSDWVFNSILTKEDLGFDRGLGQVSAMNSNGKLMVIGNPNENKFYGEVYLVSFKDNNFSGATLEGVIGRNVSGGKNLDVSTHLRESSVRRDKQLGAAVTLNSSGNLLAISAPVHTTGISGNRPGAVLLIKFSNGNFSSPTIVDGFSQGKNFGTGLSLNANGDLLAIGAQFDGQKHFGTPSEGVVYLYSFSDQSFSNRKLESRIGNESRFTANKDIKLSIANGDLFGSSVALNAAGDRLAVGATGDKGNANHTKPFGAVHLFKFADQKFSNGTHIGKIGNGYNGGANINISLDEWDSFGSSVAFNAFGDELFVGAPSDDGKNNIAELSGAVYQFKFADNSSYSLDYKSIFGKGYNGTKDFDLNLSNFNRFGYSVALNGMGDKLVVGHQHGGDFYLFNSAASTTNQNIKASELVSKLESGVDVALQANNDITFASPVKVNNLNGNGGSLTAKAGRSIFFNADIFTDNGNFTAIANTPLSDTVKDAERDPGNAVIQMKDGTTLNTGTGSVFLQLSDGNGKKYSGNGDISLANIIASYMTITNDGAIPRDVILNGLLKGSRSFDSIVIHAGRNFINNAGANAVDPGAGRFQIYSTHPSSNKTGGLMASPVYNSVFNINTFGSLSQTGNRFLYTFAPVLTVKANNATRQYGLNNPQFSSTISGLVGSDKLADAISGSPSLSTSALANSDVGTYPIFASLGTLLSDYNYGFKFLNGSLNITQATLNANINQGNALTKVYGDPNPDLIINYSGFLGSDTVAVLDTLPVASTTATQFSDVGNYPVALAGGQDNNYRFNLQPGVLSISQALLTAIAEDKQRQEGQDNPPLTFTYQGFKGNDDPVNLDAEPNISTTATKNSVAGNYPINLTGGQDKNYRFKLVDGTLSVNKKKIDDKFLVTKLIRNNQNYLEHLGFSSFKNTYLSNNELTRQDSDVLEYLYLRDTLETPLSDNELTRQDSDILEYLYLRDTLETPFDKKGPKDIFSSTLKKMGVKIPEKALHMFVELFLGHFSKQSNINKAFPRPRSLRYLFRNPESSAYELKRFALYIASEFKKKKHNFMSDKVKGVKTASMSAGNMLVSLAVDMLIDGFADFHSKLVDEGVVKYGGCIVCQELVTMTIRELKIANALMHGGAIGAAFAQYQITNQQMARMMEVYQESKGTRDEALASIIKGRSTIRAVKLLGKDGQISAERLAGIQQDARVLSNKISDRIAEYYGKSNVKKIEFLLNGAEAVLDMLAKGNKAEALDLFRDLNKIGMSSESNDKVKRAWRVIIKANALDQDGFFHGK